jgi:hypothetical protein
MDGVTFACDDILQNNYANVDLIVATALAQKVDGKQPLSRVTGILPYEYRPALLMNPSLLRTCKASSMCMFPYGCMCFGLFYTDDDDDDDDDDDIPKRSGRVGVTLRRTHVYRRLLTT